jgi:hypothetical protein
MAQRAEIDLNSEDGGFLSAQWGETIKSDKRSSPWACPENAPHMAALDIRAGASGTISDLSP